MTHAACRRCSTHVARSVVDSRRQRTGGGSRFARTLRSHASHTRFARTLRSHVRRANGGLERNAGYLAAKRAESLRVQCEVLARPLPPVTHPSEDAKNNNRSGSTTTSGRPQASTGFVAHRKCARAMLRVREQAIRAEAMRTTREVCVCVCVCVHEKRERERERSLHYQHR